MDQARVRKHVLVSGRVQGVFFRSATQEEALRLGVSGWVRNLSDGRVEAVFEGSGAAVAAALDWARHGPDHAVVESLDVTDEAPEGLSGFSIR